MKVQTSDLPWLQWFLATHTRSPARVCEQASGLLVGVLSTLLHTSSIT
jgi:hypothetical protein